MAFPAIFPASATLIEKHEKERKARAGIRNTLRGRQAAALDAPGAVLAVSVWRVCCRCLAATAFVEQGTDSVHRSIDMGVDLARRVAPPERVSSSDGYGVPFGARLD